MEHQAKITISGFRGGELRNAFDEAIAQFRKSLALDPRDAQTHNDLAFALSLKNRFDEAAVQFREAMAADP